MINDIRKPKNGEKIYFVNTFGIVDECVFEENDEMLEAATAGAKVLHNRSVSLAKKYKFFAIIKYGVFEKQCLLSSLRMYKYGIKYRTKVIKNALIPFTSFHYFVITCHVRDSS